METKKESRRRRSRPLGREASLMVERLLELQEGESVTFNELRKLTYGEDPYCKRTKRLLRRTVTKYLQREYGLTPCCIPGEDRVGRIYPLNGSDPILTRQHTNWRDQIVIQEVARRVFYGVNVHGIPLIEKQRLLLELNHKVSLMLIEGMGGNEYGNG